MYQIKNIIEWFLECWKAIPSNIVTGVLTGLCLWIFRFVINKVIAYNDKMKKALGRIVVIWKAQPDIGEKYKVIPSPQYEYFKKNKTVNSSSQNTDVLLIGVIIFSIIGCLWLRRYQEEVQTFFYFASVFLIGLSAFFIMMSAFTNRIQSSTLKFSVFSMAISVYIYYSGLVLPQC